MKTAKVNEGEVTDVSAYLVNRIMVL